MCACTFDGETIWIDGFGAGSRSGGSGEGTGELATRAAWRKYRAVTFEVRSVIVYPGWYVDEGNAKQGVVWVLAPKRLPAFLDHEPRRLSQEDIQLTSFHLSRFVRTAAR